MGGCGSTRCFLHDKKHMVDEYHQLYIRAFDKVLLADVCSAGGKVYYADSRTVKLVDKVLRKYGIDRKPLPRIQGIAVDRIPMRYGGQRYYLLCPKCGRRCEILYFPDTWVHIAACRLCYDLTYQSSQEAHQLDRGVLGDLGRRIETVKRLENVYAKMERCRFGSKNWQRWAARAWLLAQGL